MNITVRKQSTRSYKLKLKAFQRFCHHQQNEYNQISGKLYVQIDIHEEVNIRSLLFIIA